MRTDPRPNPDTMGFYYPDDYGPYLGTKVMTSRLGSLWRRCKALGRDLLGVNSLSLPPDISPGLMLEVGCASGGFLAHMAGRGWNVEGIEFSPSAAESARKAGFSVYAGSLESAPEPSRTYDMVAGWMVLEHLHEPVMALRKLHGWTRPAGWLVASVPNAGSFQLGMFNENWYALHLPAHLYHYTPDTLTKLLERTGWRVEKIHQQKVMTDVIGSIGYLLENRFPSLPLGRWLGTHPGVLNLPLFPLSWLMAMLGHSGRMTVWARRAAGDE
jgi:2-polyprenyl-3-methyl-5-hydroxy-6-metoxy-1,4-benzoquinol methylase